MPETQPIKTNMTAGELSPRLAGRVDLDRYANGVAVMENFLPLVTGGAIFRPGTRFIRECLDSTKKSRVVQFEFNKLQAYILEFGEGKIRFFKDEGTIVSGTSDAAVTNGDFVSDISGWTAVGTPSWVAGKAELGTGDSIEQAIAVTDGNIDATIAFDISSTSIGDAVLFQVGSTSGASDIVASSSFLTGYHLREFDPLGNTTFYIQFTNSDGTPSIDNIRFQEDTAISLNSPFLETELFELHFAQSADVLYIAHSSHRPLKLERYSHQDWSLREVVFEDGPYAPKNVDLAVTMSSSALTGTVTITATGGEPFASTDVGRFLALQHPRTQTQKDDEVNPWGYGTITAFTSSTIVTLEVERDFLIASPSTDHDTSDWQLGSWSDTLGYPVTLSFYEERLWWAGSTAYPNTVWGSKSGDYENNGAGVNPTDAVAYTLSTDQVNTARWLQAGRVLTLGTLGAEFTIKAADINEAITPDNVVIKRETSHGSSYFQPVRVDNMVLFPQRAKRKLREFVYSFEVDGYVSTDLGILSEHILRKGFENMTYQQEPQSIVWAPTADGVCPTMTYQKDQKVIAWARQIFAGTDTVVESVATIPTDSANQVWATVSRTINGATFRSIEVLQPFFWEDDAMAKEDAWFVDCGLKYDGAATTSLSGLDHLEGETVTILANGAVHQDVVVASGAVELDYEVTKAIVGLGYTGVIESLNFEGGNPLGTAQGKKTRITSVTMRFFQTLGGYSGYNADSMNEIIFREADDVMDDSPPLFTGDVDILIDKGTTTEPKVRIEQRQPLPMTLLSFMPNYEVVP